MKQEKQDDMPFFDMSSASDLYRKLKNDYETINKNHTPYSYMDFIFTARHLEEWIIKSDNNKEIKQICKNILNFKINEEWSTIISLCNREKHFYKSFEFEKKKIKNIGLFDYGYINYANFSYRTSSYEVEVGRVMKNLDDVCNKIMNDYKIIFGE